MFTGNVKIKRALLSVSDKTDLLKVATILQKFNVEMISTGGTYKTLTDNKFKVTPITEVTNNPESFGGRMKTISFQIGSSLLFRRDNAEDQADAKKLNISAIDLVVCNLYPFSEAVSKNAELDELIENVDVGGPTMIRASAKNFNHVTVLTNPNQYEEFIHELEKSKGETSFEFRKKVAVNAFELTAQYDVMISLELGKKLSPNKEKLDLKFINLSSERKELRYGENPHQKCYFYPFNNKEGSSLGSAKFLQGKELSYNNLLDGDAAWKVMSDVYNINKNKKFVVSLVKHLNPCGIAVADSLIDALLHAWEGDPVSAFGGILSFSHELNKECAEFLSDKFVEVVLAPNFSDEALKILSTKKNLRLLTLENNLELSNEVVVRSISGGILIQDEDEGMDSEFQSATTKEFPKDRMDLVKFGLMVNKHLKSNSISLVGETKKGVYSLVGAGMGQPNRLDSLKLLAEPRATNKKSVPTDELVLISDAFFPFKDSIEVANSCGIKYIVQPGGSIRDNEVIAACNDFNISMIFTKRRHFRH